MQHSPRSFYKLSHDCLKNVLLTFVSLITILINCSIWNPSFIKSMLLVYSSFVMQLTQFYPTRSSVPTSRLKIYRVWLTIFANVSSVWILNLSSSHVPLAHVLVQWKLLLNAHPNSLVPYERFTKRYNIWVSFTQSS